jgi:hypothetical protein
MTAALDEAGKSAWCRERGVYLLNARNENNRRVAVG